MANRYYTQYMMTLAKQPVMLFGRVTFGATGAPTLVAADSKGIKTIVRNSAGNYTITLGNTTSGNDIYPKFFGFDYAQVAPTGTPAAPSCFIVSQAVATTTPTVVVQYVAANGTTATDPASGESVFFTVTLGNSTAQ